MNFHWCVTAPSFVQLFNRVIIIMINHPSTDTHGDAHKYTHIQKNYGRLFIVGMVIVTILGMWIRWQFITHPMRYDESYNFLRFVTQSPSYIATHYVPNNHILHTLMVKLTSYFLGTDTWVLRLPAFIAGVLLIPATALLGWTIFHCRLTAWVAALAVCGTSQLIEYSTNARGYTWLTLFTTLITLCTIHVIHYPHRRYLWFSWASLGILATYTLPIAACPIVGLLVTMAYFALRAPHGSDDRKHLIKAICVCTSLWLIVSGLAYLPILMNQGIRETMDTFNISYSVWNRYIPSGAQSLIYAWLYWTKDNQILWGLLLITGFVLFLIKSIQHRTPQYLTPLFMIASSIAVVWIANAPLCPRAWMFVLPIILVCTIGGLRMFVAELSSSRLTRSVSVVATIMIVTLASHSLWTTSGKKYLASEPNTLVDIEDIIYEYENHCQPHSALLVRYTPATQYYFMKKNLPAPRQPRDPSVSQVMIVVEDIRPLKESWHEGVEGFNDYAQAKFFKQLHQCKLYIADRLEDRIISNHAKSNTNSTMLVKINRPNHSE